MNLCGALTSHRRSRDCSCRSGLAALVTGGWQEEQPAVPGERDDDDITMP
jgi:hypothetical protein